MKRKSNKELHADSAILDKIGGTVEISKICEVTPSLVSQWRRNGIYKTHRRYLEALYPKAFKVKK